MKKKNLGDSAIAVAVILCSAVLFCALAFALGGNPFSRPERTVRVFLPDATGVAPASAVRLGGAHAGRVFAVRMLDPDERAATGDPANQVELTLALSRAVPPLTRGTSASIASDTLLADKFVLLTGGPPDAEPIANGALVPGIPPTTFDELARNLDRTVVAINQLVDGAAGPGEEIPGLFAKINGLLDQADRVLESAEGLVSGADSLVGRTRGVVENGDTLVGEARALVANADSFVDETRPPARELIAKLGSAADALDRLAARVDQLVRSNEKPLARTLANADSAADNLRVTSAYLRELSRSLLSRPQQLIWGTRRSPNPPPDDIAPE